MDTPTMKRKNGKTRSVGVRPFHSACRKGGKIYAQDPGVFTRIMPAMVKPLKASRDISLFDVLVSFSDISVTVIEVWNRNGREGRDVREDFFLFTIVEDKKRRVRSVRRGKYFKITTTAQSLSSSEYPNNLSRN
jgi:hypothetical protein